MLNEYYLDYVPTEATIRKWSAKFRTDHISPEDNEDKTKRRKKITNDHG